MTTEAYVRDPRFEVHGAAIRWWDGKTEWVPAKETVIDPRLGVPYRDLPVTFDMFDWSETAVVCHHAQFDGLILSHHYGIKPAFWLDTLSMARLVVGNHISVGLDSLAKHFGLQPKSVPYSLFKGRHWNEITSDVQRQVADGACHDVELTWSIFERLLKGV